jgi:hypothetical protein
MAYGIPAIWVMDGGVGYFDGQEVTFQALPLSGGVPVDPAFPPLYESEAAYLKRLGLLLPGEARHLRQADFEPEALTIEEKAP